ncbi:MAG: hypothetical protein IJA53_12225 [Spirochaetaceae bacterium]|nr:hypothetical protein [Spirochaetaceae bacterium]
MTTFNIVITSLNILFWILIFIFRKKILKNMIETVQRVSLGNIKQEVDKILIEIDKVTDRDLSMVENRIRTLREVIDLADKRIILAEKELQKREKQIQTLNQIDEIKTSVKRDNASMNSYVENAYRVNKREKSDGGISLFASDDYEQKSQKELSLKDKVVEMFNQGIDVYLIAEKLDSSVAEVQTIVNLFCH